MTIIIGLNEDNKNNITLGIVAKDVFIEAAENTFKYLGYKLQQKDKIDKNLLQEFISKFASQFEDEDPSVFTADTDYHELDSWSSLTGLSVVAMIIQEYGVELDSQDVRKADTIEDLFNLVNERQA